MAPSAQTRVMRSAVPASAKSAWSILPAALALLSIWPCPLVQASTVAQNARAYVAPDSVSPASVAPDPIAANAEVPGNVRAGPAATHSDLKRRIALVRFEDSSAFSGHGLGPGEDPASVAGALLAAGMAAGGECVVMKRGQLGDMDRVAGVQGREPEVIGVTAFLYGSVDKLNQGHAKVSVRMVDPLTGVAFFSESGEADAAPEPPRLFRAAPAVGRVADPAAEPDSVLPKRALRAAVGKLVASMTVSLRTQPWRAGILEVTEGKVTIAAGARAGLRPGLELSVVRPGKRLLEPSSGLIIELPGEEVGRIQVLSQFGTGELDEGSVCALLTGNGITKGDRVEQVDGIGRVEERR